MENDQQTPAAVFQQEARRVRPAAGEGMKFFVDLRPGGQPEQREFFSQGDQTLIVAQRLQRVRAFKGVPPQGVHPVRRAVAVVNKPAPAGGLGTEHFFPGLEEGHALRENAERGCQPVPAGKLLLGNAVPCQGNPVRQGIVIMAGTIVDALLRVLRPPGTARKGSGQLRKGRESAGGKPRVSGFKQRPPD